MAEQSKKEIHEINNSKKDEKVIDNTSEQVGELFEQLEQGVIANNNLALVNGLNAFGTLNDWKANQRKYNDTFIRSIDKQRDAIDKEINKQMEYVKKTIGFVPRVNFSDTTEQLVNSGERYRKIAYKNILQSTKTRPLYEAIFRQTQIGINKGLKIAIRSKKPNSDETIVKHWNYKSYMEMNVRTTIAHEITENMQQAGEANQVVFYITNHFGDCAKDHAPYQDKMYYDRNWKSFKFSKETKEKIQNFIDSRGLKSMQEVRDSSPYLTTRPNCRHIFNAITVDEALGKSVSNIQEDLGIRRGTYKSGKYIASQNLRNAERTIRKYKTRLEQNGKLMEASKDSELKKLYADQIAKDRQLVRAWQKIANGIVSKSNKENNLTKDDLDYLKRDYRRENPNLIIQDLGAKYNQPKN